MMSDDTIHKVTVFVDHIEETGEWAVVEVTTFGTQEEAEEHADMLCADLDEIAELMH